MTVFFYFVSRNWESLSTHLLTTMRLSQALITFLLMAASPTSLAEATASARDCEVSHPRAKVPLLVQATGQQWLPTMPNLESLPRKEVQVCCQPSEACTVDGQESVFEPVNLGIMPQFQKSDALYVLQKAQEAWNGGMGVWPQMSLAKRIQAIENFFQEISKSRERIVTTLMWEIGKNRKDAESEFDRTLEFAKSVIETIRTDPEFSGNEWKKIGSTRAFIRRSAIGIVLALGPYNYPLNETYATLIPALLMGNVCILKIPTIGGLVHLLTLDAFRKALPENTVTFVAGAGRTTMPPLMETGKIDVLAFIGGSSAADKLIHQHPHPHRLKVFLQLEANNMGVFLPDVLEDTSVLDIALDELVVGALSFNGQRCTAVKLAMVPEKQADFMVKRIVERVDAVPVGLQWQQHDGVYSKITPLPSIKRIEYMKELLEDALSKGAKIQNKDGGKVIGGSESTLMVPAVLYPVTPEMKVYHEEQFGPILPIVPYDSIEKVVEFARIGKYAQQISIFGRDSDQTARLLDRFSSIFAKVNLNSACGRSPDTLPFAGRRSSAMGVMSVSDALREFSVPTVVSYKENAFNEGLRQGLERKSVFMESV